MTRRSPVPRSFVLLLFLPVVIVVGFAFSWARNAESNVQPRPMAAIAYSPR